MDYSNNLPEREPPDRDKMVKAAERIMMAVRAHRATTDQSVKQVARRMGVQVGYIYTIESGKRNLTIGNFIRYAAACGLKIQLSPVTDESEPELKGNE